MHRTLPTSLICLMLASCASTQSTPPAYLGCKTHEQQISEGDASARAVAVLSPELAKVLGVRQAFPGRTDSGLVNVQATLYNCTDVDVAVQARTHFSGTAGLSEPDSAWKALFLPPRGQVTYLETAISERTTRVSVEVIDANRGQSQFAPGQTYTVPRANPSQVQP